MDITIYPRKLYGSISAIPSKSQAHRLLICAAFSDRPTTLLCPETNQDIEATADCLRSLGALVTRTENGYAVHPVSDFQKSAVLNCRESGSTLRFMLPIAGALGVDAIFQMAGRLSQRPLSPLWEEMERMGCRLTWISHNELHLEGQLKAGDYSIDGGVSSQFITGLLFAASLLQGSSRIHITGKLESKPYIKMTQRAMSLFGIETEDYLIRGGQQFRSPGTLKVEGDWSNAAFFLAAQNLGSSICLTGLEPDSPQGDRAVLECLEKLDAFCTISASHIPDLVPILSVVAAAKHGAVFTDIRRLRMKESDRVESTISLLKNLGIHAEASDSGLTVYPGTFTSGTVDTVNDHRIAMAAAVAATVADGPVTILGAECVKKSYPGFWDEYRSLGGQYELYLR